MEAATTSLQNSWPEKEDGTKLPFSSTAVLLLRRRRRRPGHCQAAAEAGRQHDHHQPHRRARQKLAEEVGCRWVDWAARHNALCDILINCTSVGMHPNLDECPVHGSYLAGGMLVFDTIYTPETTMLIREARSRGCPVLTGVDMFVRQAALQFQLFTGLEAAAEELLALVRRALSPVNLGQDDTRV